MTRVIQWGIGEGVDDNELCFCCAWDRSRDGVVMMIVV